MASNNLLPPKVNVPATPALEGVDIRSLYDVDNGTLLGKGGFSEVVAVTHLPTGERRALKVMERSILTGKKGEMVTHEKEILRRTCHPNIVTLYESIQTPDKVYFALDLMQEDLFEFIVRNKRVNEGLTRKIMYYVLSGINYLHEQSIVHRDIKPENILINTRYSPAKDLSEEEAERILSEAKNVNDLNPDEVEVDVKLADFGLAKLVVEWDVRSTPCGTSFYIAPEVIRGIENQGAKPLCTNQRLVKSIDIWSAGVVFFVLLSGRPPFHGQVKTGEERRALLKKIDHGVLFNSNHGWDNISDEAKDLIVVMLQQDVTNRISAAEALAHPFFTKHGYLRPVPGGDPVARQKAQIEYLRQLQRNQQQQQQMASTEGSGSNYTSTTTTTAAAGNPNVNHNTAANDLNSPNSSESSSKRKKRNIFENMRHFFNGSHGSNKNGNNNNGGQAVVPLTGEEKQIQAELNEMQQEVVRAEDKEGDETSYRTNMPIKESKASKPAVMNAKARVGPGALKK